MIRLPENWSRICFARSLRKIILFSLSAFPGAHRRPARGPFAGSIPGAKMPGQTGRRPGRRMRNRKLSRAGRIDTHKTIGGWIGYRVRCKLSLLTLLAACVFALSSCGHKTSLLGRWTLVSPSPPGSATGYEFSAGHHLTITENLEVGTTRTYIVTAAEYRIGRGLLTQTDITQTRGVDPETRALIRRRLARLAPHFESIAGAAEVTTPLSSPPIVYQFTLTDRHLTLQDDARPGSPPLSLTRAGSPP
jgi:hypothetical protein